MGISRELRKHEPYRDLAAAVTDRGEESVADLLVNVELAEINRDRAELRDIEAALRRLSQGAYGICVDCDESISRKRLETIPSAVRCVPCQRRFERRDPHPTL